MNKVRTEIYLTYSQKNQLQVWSNLKGKTMGLLVREAVDSYLQDLTGQRQKKLDVCIAYINGSITRAQLDEVLNDE